MKAFKYFILPLICVGAAFFVLSNNHQSSHFNDSEQSPNVIDLGFAPSFQLESSLTEPFSTESIKGKVWLFNLFFTSCKGPCPITSAHLKTIYNKHRDNDSLALVSLSVDPETDTKQKLIEYADKLKVSSEKWSFVRAELEKVKELSEAFKMETMEHHGMVHSNRVVLIDAQNKIRGTYLGTEKADIEKLEIDLEKLFIKS